MVTDATMCFEIRAFLYDGEKEREVGLGERVTLFLMEPYENSVLNVTAKNLSYSGLKSFMQ